MNQFMHRYRDVPHQLGHAAARMAASIAAFVVAVVGITVSLSTLVVAVGIPVGAGFLRLLRWFGDHERRSAATVLGRPVVIPPGLRTGRWGAATIGDRAAYRDLAQAFVGFPVAILTFVTGLSWAAAAVGGVAYPVWAWLLPGDSSGLVSLLGGRPSPVGDTVLYVSLGVLALYTLPAVMTRLTAAQAGAADAVLVGDAGRLRARNAALAQSRRAAATAEGAALRRLERDIHDGPQQRLLRIAMDLDLAERRIDDDPAGARELVTSATVQARDTLTELRGLSRGVAPPELTEQGLAAALRALAARSSVPTPVDVGDGGADLSAEAQRAAYFVVAECLANVAKHSGASSCRVEVVADDAAVRVIVADDGVGGACSVPGHGLDGLGERLRGLDGRVMVDSPMGGPTTVTAELPVVDGTGTA
ncbi:MAG: sensor histidine kinase [Dermatophilaceae bacterium]